MSDEPLVMCLTNTVAANFTANVLLAIGAKPAMIEEPSEAAQLAAVADAVLVNLGTVTPAQADVMRSAVAVCQLGTDPQSKGTDPGERRGIPWVLDPVAVHVLDYRQRLAREFLQAHPALIRGNHAEIDFLKKYCGELLGSVPLLSTGEEDRVWLPDGVLRIAGGVPMLQTVTATGCAQGAICAALLGWGQTPAQAAETASRLMKRAGEVAFGLASKPGSFQSALLDALYELSPLRRGED